MRNSGGVVVTSWRHATCLAAALLALCGAGAAESPGASSATVPHAARALLLDGASAGDRLIVVGERGHILVSDDGAENWRLVASPTQALLTAIYMHDKQLGWAVGHDAVILRTIDGGESWQRVHHAPEEERPLLDILFTDAKNGLAIGAYGYLLVSEDGGETWISGEVGEDDYHMNAVTSASGVLYVGAEAGIAYHSQDGGANWRLLEPPYSGSWFGAAAVNANTVILVGLRGRIFRSDDGGSGWTRIQTGTTASLTSIQRMGPERFLITGLDGVLLESHDGGRSVSLRRLPDRAGISGALPLADGDLLLIGEFGIRRLPADR